MPTFPSPPDDHRRDIDSPLGRVAATHDERMLVLYHWIDNGYFDGGHAFVRSAEGWMMWLAAAQPASDAAAPRSTRTGDGDGAARRRSSRTRTSKKSPRASGGKSSRSGSGKTAKKVGTASNATRAGKKSRKKRTKKTGRGG